MGWAAWLWVIGGLAVVGALVVALFVPDAPVVRSLPIWRNYSTPSESMHPTLRIGEYFFADINYYRSRNPEYGDLALFLHGEAKTVYIKRVVGKPGDRVQMVGGVLHINGQPVKYEPAGTDVRSNNNRQIKAAKIRVTLPNGVSYHVVDTVPNGPGDNTAEFALPEGCYFVLGDNLDNSNDSRSPAPYGVGYVRREQFFGRATYIFISSEWARVGIHPDREAAGAN